MIDKNGKCGIDNSCPVNEVWAVPVSLTATYGITIVLFSSPYLDVSVQVVASTRLINLTRGQEFGTRVSGETPEGFPHSDTDG